MNIQESVNKHLAARRNVNEISKAEFLKRMERVKRGVQSRAKEVQRIKRTPGEPLIGSRAMKKLDKAKPYARALYGD